MRASLVELARRARNAGWQRVLDVAEAPLTRSAITRLGRAHARLNHVRARFGSRPASSSLDPR